LGIDPSYESILSILVRIGFITGLFTCRPAFGGSDYGQNVNSWGPEIMLAAGMRPYTGEGGVADSLRGRQAAVKRGCDGRPSSLCLWVYKFQRR
jgi:hypothetical protein